MAGASRTPGSTNRRLARAALPRLAVQHAAKRRKRQMTRHLRSYAVVAGLLIALVAAPASLAQKQGGILRVYMIDSPASMSIHEESTVVAERPVMGVFNNLVLFDQHVKQNNPDAIVPELATGWSWSEDGTELTFPLRQSVKWHDGKPFTAKDVKCTWDLLAGRSAEKFRINPRKDWYRNLEEVTTNGDYEVTFHLKRPQPGLLELLASGWSPVYPCHVSPRDMRSHPVGTGPFKFVEFKPNEHIWLRRNEDYWKKDRPYLDGVEYTILKSRSTVILAFIAGEIRPDLCRQRVDSVAARHPEPDARGDLPVEPGERQHHPDHQPDGAAF